MTDEELQRERDALLAEIKAAFVGVSREGGTSWSQADVLDWYGSDAEMAAALARDTERRWEDLIEDANWEPVGAAAFSFLDAIGFRYYLAPAMMRAVRSGDDEGIQFHLSLIPESQSRASVEFPDGHVEMFARASESSRKYKLQQWSALDQRQRRCVARFLRFMISVSLLKENKSEADYWQEALDGYWCDYLA